MAVDTRRFVSLFLQGEPTRAPDWTPATDIYRTPNGWMVKMELAGVRPEDLELALRGRSLFVRGRRRDCCQGPNCRQLHMEISYSRFERQIDLPPDLEAARISSDYRDGMLHILIERGG
jgi:HSP20 family protein